MRKIKYFTPSIMPPFRESHSLEYNSFKEVLEKTLESWVIEPQFALLSISDRKKVCPLYLLYLVSFAPDPVMNVEFKDEKEVEDLFRQILGPYIYDDKRDALFRAQYTISRYGRTFCDHALFIARMMLFIKDNSVDEIREGLDYLAKAKGGREKMKTIYYALD